MRRFIAICVIFTSSLSAYLGDYDTMEQENEDDIPRPKIQYVPSLIAMMICRI